MELDRRQDVLVPAEYRMGARVDRGVCDFSHVVKHILRQAPMARGYQHINPRAQGANIIANHEFADREAMRFFMRTEFVGAADDAALVTSLRSRLPLGANVRIGRPNRHRIAILATKEYHCLGELLLRHAHGELGASIAMVISNHDTLAPLVGQFGIPFHVVSHQGLTREAHEAQMLEQLRALAAGIPIGVASTPHLSLGVDVPSDVASAEALLRERGLAR